ncbi:MAG TPA: cytochrome d ubiquinol oxidase subunit II [Bacteroidota bacterium]|nr:cytochrome d ubiquinol oxidase subunit II [Bacteroidota bacterium]
METLWFALVAFMLVMYVLLDGFDLGAGIIHLFAGKTEDERRLILNAIGPVWDGNEVWILAAGGTLCFAFPLVYASSFSGFYLPLIIVLWLLMMRGLGIEFRHQLHHPMWLRFWDGVFSISSALLAIFLGAALGNVVRGVPLNADGYFFEPLWTTFTIVPDPGILDWYTVILGVVAFFTLTVHGASYVAAKTDGIVQQRSRSFALQAWWGVLLASGAGAIATFAIKPELARNFSSSPVGLVLPLVGIAGLAGVRFFLAREQDLRALLSSGAFIVGMLGATAFALYPNLLPSSTDPSLSLTIQKCAAQHYGLTVGLVWWVIGILLASGYFVYVYRSFAGKVRLPLEGSGY